MLVDCVKHLAAIWLYSTDTGAELKQFPPKDNNSACDRITTWFPHRYDLHVLRFSTLKELSTPPPPHFTPPPTHIHRRQANTYVWMNYLRFQPGDFGFIYTINALADYAAWPVRQWERENI